MALFSKGKIQEDKQDNTGLVVVDVRVRRRDRQERKVKLTIVEQETGDTVGKMDFSDKRSQSDYGAYTRAVEIARLYCRNQDYVIADMLENMEDKPVVKTAEKRAR